MRRSFGRSASAASWGLHFACNNRCIFVQHSVRVTLLTTGVPQDLVVITHDQGGNWMIFRKYHRMGSLEGDRSVTNSSSDAHGSFYEHRKKSCKLALTFNWTTFGQGINLFGKGLVLYQLYDFLGKAPHL